LRTLAFAKKEIDEGVVAKLKAADWSDEATAAEIEKDLELLGITGVEDLLAEDVDSCIKDFREAGIHVWMLTGDKCETAKEIAISCNLIDRDRIDHLIALDEDQDWRTT
jgi:phospholipid-translocating ATPase